MSIGKKIAQILFKVILIIAAAALILLLYLSVTEYKPKDIEDLAMIKGAEKNISLGQDIKMISWNIGYAALGDNADFFMDGGKSVISSEKERVLENLEQIKSDVKNMNPDLAFFQEVDLSSTRSYKINQQAVLSEVMQPSDEVFANNFKVKYIPGPIPPLGKVDSGLVTFSKYTLDSSIRQSLPVPFKWPYRIINLKRALQISRAKIENSNKELVLINLHLEAYDDGEGKIAQTKALTKILNEEVQKGNYVIAGGDFNQIFSTVDENAFPKFPDKWPPGIINVEEIGDFQFLMDDTAPSCRSLDRPYVGESRENFQFDAIDGLIVSKNITVEEFKTVDLDFVSSDHNPVYMQFKLN